MSEPPSTRPARSTDRRTLLERIVEFVSPGPDSKDELIKTLAHAEQRELIEPESRAMLEGVLRMADLTASDVMVAALRMDLLDIDAAYEELLHVVIDTAHSRFPVYEGRRENVIGILMAKDPKAEELNVLAMTRSRNWAERVKTFKAYHEYILSQYAFEPIYEPVNIFAYSTKKLKLPETVPARASPARPSSTPKSRTDAGLRKRGSG